MAALSRRIFKNNKKNNNDANIHSWLEAHSISKQPKKYLGSSNFIQNLFVNSLQWSSVGINVIVVLSLQEDGRW